MLENGLLKDCGGFYENKHIYADLVAVSFTDMTDDELHQSLLEADTILLKNLLKGVNDFIRERI